VIRPLTLSDLPACERILRALPDWFGLEEGIQRYVAHLGSLDGYVVEVEGEVVGVVGLLRHNLGSVEIDVIAVAPTRHGQGLGSALVQAVEDSLHDARPLLLHTKTLGPSHPDSNYAATRKFWAAMGFLPTEETTLFWGEDNPCLILVKPLLTEQR
jgi:GNAT superfamily N-acetyltransferase